MDHFQRASNCREHYQLLSFPPTKNQTKKKNLQNLWSLPRSVTSCNPSPSPSTAKSVSSEVQIHTLPFANTLLMTGYRTSRIDEMQVFLVI